MRKLRPSTAYHNRINLNVCSLNVELTEVTYDKWLIPICYSNWVINMILAIWNLLQSPTCSFNLSSKHVLCKALNPYHSPISENWFEIPEYYLKIFVIQNWNTTNLALLLEIQQSINTMIWISWITWSTAIRYSNFQVKSESYEHTVFRKSEISFIFRLFLGSKSEIFLISCKR